MTEIAIQNKLSTTQLEAFYHDEFVEDQVRDFCALVEPPAGQKVVADIGGGCGFFARRLADLSGARTRVIDMDPGSIERCRELGVDGRLGDALAPQPSGDEDVVCFNLILHHLVGRNERETRVLQMRALQTWHDHVRGIFVNEYIYQSFVRSWSGRLIYQITSSAVLSIMGKQIGRIIPALRANTFGVGVRFRSNEEWQKLFADAGYRVAGYHEGQSERIALPLRGLVIKTIRRDSYFLEPVFN